MKKVMLKLTAFLAFLTASTVVLAQQAPGEMMSDGMMADGMMSNGMMMSGPMMAICMLFGLLVFIVLVLALVALIKYLRSGKD